MEEEGPQRERRQKCQNVMVREAEEDPKKQRFLKAERKTRKSQTTEKVSLKISNLASTS